MQTNVRPELREFKSERDVPREGSEQIALPATWNLISVFEHQ